MMWEQKELVGVFGGNGAHDHRMSIEGKMGTEHWSTVDGCPDSVLKTGKESRLDVAQAGKERHDFGHTVNKRWYRAIDLRNTSKDAEGMLYAVSIAGAELRELERSEEMEVAVFPGTAALPYLQVFLKHLVASQDDACLSEVVE